MVKKRRSRTAALYARPLRYGALKRPQPQRPVQLPAPYPNDLALPVGPQEDPSWQARLKMAAVIFSLLSALVTGLFAADRGCANPHHSIRLAATVCERIGAAPKLPTHSLR